MNAKLIQIALVIIASISLTACPAPAQPPRGFGPPPGGPGGMQPSRLALLETEQVREELAINDEQKPKIDNLLKEWQEQSRAPFDAAFREARDQSEQERRKSFDDARRKSEEVTSQTEKRLAGILKAPQLQRLDQLLTQQQGVSALITPEVIKQLKLTAKQQKTIRALQQDSQPRGFGPPGFGPPGPPRADEDSMKKAVATLSDSQRTAWLELTGKPFDLPPPQFGPGRRGGPPGFGPGGPKEKRKLVKQFDKDENGWLNQQERRPARALVKSEPATGRRFGPPGGRGRGREPAKPGRSVSPGDVKNFADADLYAPDVLRTLFFEFENDDWEMELQDFHGTDVDVPATLIVDGKKYSNVGVRFRGMSSYGMVSAGHKRSFNVKMDMADEDQRLYGFKTLNLLNSAGDPSFMSTALYSHIASKYIPVPKANHVHVVVNGKSWGVYVNVQQFNKDFLAEHFKSTKGTRWKVSGSPGGDGGLRYTGDELEEYKRRFDMKSNDGKKAWKALVLLCKTLNETPLDELQNALEPMLDIDETLRFLALDVALVNSDGYWTRASDYSLFLDSDKKFHVIPHDMNEAFHSGRRGPGGPPRGRGGAQRPGFPGPGGPGGFGPPPGAAGPGGPRPGGVPRDADASPQRDRRPAGPGVAGGRPGGFRGPGGPGHGGVDLDPLVSIDNPRMPLRSRLLAVPALRAKYLQYVRQIASESLDWKQVAPVVAKRVKLIKDEVAADTRKLDSLQAFEQAVSDDGSGDDSSLRSFFEQRRKYLLNYKEPAAGEGKAD